MTFRCSACWLAAIALTATSSSVLAQAPLSEAEALEIGTNAYVFGYPLVTMEMTRRVMTNVTEPNGKFAPMGQFANLRNYPSPNDKEVTAPNADTLYSLCWLDLSKEPYVVSIPNESGRYFLMPMLSGWTDVFSVPGKRTTGTGAQTYALTGPGWRGTLPNGVTEVKSPTAMVWILARTYCTGTPDDYKAVHAIQDQYKVAPLSLYGTSHSAPPGKVDASIDMKTPVRDQVNKMDAASYFHLLAELMKTNPPSEADGPIIAEMAKIGLIPGKSFDLSKLDPTIRRAFSEAPSAGFKAILAHKAESGEMVNGWTFSLKTGRYGTDYIQRAFITAVGLGANRPDDAVYPMCEVDINGEQLTGSKSYVLHFEKGHTPPVGAFWSLTMYDSAYFFVPNKLNRFTVSPRDALRFEPDGSLNLHISHEPPGKALEANWLPAPQGNFVLMLRMYWPKEAVLKGLWKPPIVEPVADEPASRPNQPVPLSDVKMIDALNQAFTTAFDKGDAKAIVELFSEDAELKHESGEMVKGKAQIAKHFAEVFREDPKATIEVSRGVLKFLSPDVARESGVARVNPANGGSPEISEFSVIYTRKNGKWLHEVIEESARKNITPHERLLELAWLIGDWVDETPDAVIHTSCHWSPDQNYLLRDFSMNISGKAIAKGTQRIGWDPANEQFKSWVFDDDGGHSEGLWTRTGKNEWTIEASGVLADGRAVLATQVLTVVNKSTAKWKSIDRTIDGEAVPDLEEITLVRSAPKAKK